MVDRASPWFSLESRIERMMLDAEVFRPCEGRALTVIALDAERDTVRFTLPVHLAIRNLWEGVRIIFAFRHVVFSLLLGMWFIFGGECIESPEDASARKVMIADKNADMVALGGTLVVATSRYALS